MINFIQNHPLLVIAIGLIIALLLVLAIIKVSKSGSKAKNASKKSTETKEVKTKETKSEKKEEKTTKKEKKDKKDKKDKEKEEKKVEQVYKTEKKEDKSEEEKKKEQEKDEKELLEKMAFVKTGKTISKLAKKEWIERVPESEFTTEELIAIDSLIREKEILDESKKSSHFNKSIRLSNFTKNGNYDDMFISHISDDVTKISAKKHLDINDAYMERLYSRSINALARSGVVDSEFDSNNDDDDSLAEQLGDSREAFAQMIDTSYKDTPNTVLPESEYMDDTIDLGPENILVVDSVMNRKNRKN